MPAGRSCTAANATETVTRPNTGEHRNTTIAKPRSPAERTNATLKAWRTLHTYRGNHHRPTTVIQAILTREYTR